MSRSTPAAIVWISGLLLTLAAMTVLAAILFRHLRRRYRVPGFSPLALVALGFLLMETAAL